MHVARDADQKLFRENNPVLSALASNDFRGILIAHRISLSN